MTDPPCRGLITLAPIAEPEQPDRLEEPSDCVGRSAGRGAPAAADDRQTTATATSYRCAMPSPPGPRPGNPSETLASTACRFTSCFSPFTWFDYARRDHGD